MIEDKENKQKDSEKDKKHIKPGEIQGKIEVSDTRERRDGPGGN